LIKWDLKEKARKQAGVWVNVTRKKIQKVSLIGQTGFHEEDQGEGGVSGIETGILKMNK
jgi:hypothetical protein